MLVRIKDCSKRLEETGTIDAKYIAHEMLKVIRAVDKKSVYLVVCDGGADWTACKTMIAQAYPWIHFVHCVAHVGSLIIKGVCQIEVIRDLLIWISDAQHWFSTNKLKPLLQRFCKEHYGTTRSFIFPAETRFAGKLLQIKRFLSMKSALQQCVRSSQYMRFEFLDDPFVERITDGEVWRLMRRVVKAAGPIMLLIRLADSNKPTLSKLKGTVEYISSQMLDSGSKSLEDQIYSVFAKRVPDLESDIATAVYILDPQFLEKSASSGSSTMLAFWTVARRVLRVTDDAK